MAAEIAISDTENLPSKKVKKARGIIETRSLNGFHISELASALGTIELRDGSKKKGKKLFAIALLSFFFAPTQRHNCTILEIHNNNNNNTNHVFLRFIAC